MAKTKKITLENVAEIVKSSNKNLAEAIDSLARMTQGGLIDVENRLSKKIDKISTDVEELKEGHERIEMRLANVAYHFEIVALQGRVEALEEKLGIKSSK